MRITPSYPQYPPPSVVAARSTTRKGLSLIEAIASIGLLIVTCSSLVPFLNALSHTRQQLSDREVSLQELKNIIEQTRVIPDSSPELSPWIKEYLDSPTLDIQRTPLEGTPPTIQLTARLSWINREGEQTMPVEISYWQIEESQE